MEAQEWILISFPLCVTAIAQQKTHIPFQKGYHRAPSPSNNTVNYTHMYVLYVLHVKVVDDIKKLIILSGGQPRVRSSKNKKSYNLKNILAQAALFYTGLTMPGFYTKTAPFDVPVLFYYGCSSWKRRKVVSPSDDDYWTLPSASTK
jgi:hypothetical protein